MTVTVLVGASVIVAWFQIREVAGAEAGAFGISAALAFAIWLAAIAAIAASLRWQDVIADRVSGLGSAVRVIGLFTYPLYLLHMHVGGSLFVAMRRADVLDTSALALSFAVTVAASMLVAMSLEPPLHRTVSPLAKLTLKY